MSAKIPSDLIIVVGRQFGSGGRRIGNLLARIFSLAYYDKEMLAEASEQFGFSQNIFARCDEKRPSALRALLTNAFGVGDAYAPGPMSDEAIYSAQSHVIRELASRGGCVFVGRSADYILREHPHVVSIFLSSPIEQRAKAIFGRGDAPTLEKARELAARCDRAREDFYNYFTGRKWGRSDNYHLSLDTSLLNDEAAVDVITKYIEGRFNSPVGSPDKTTDQDTGQDNGGPSEV